MFTKLLIEGGGRVGILAFLTIVQVGCGLSQQDPETLLYSVVEGNEPVILAQEDGVDFGDRLSPLMVRRWP